MKINSCYKNANLNLPINTDILKQEFLYLKFHHHGVQHMASKMWLKSKDSPIVREVPLPKKREQCT